MKLCTTASLVVCALHRTDAFSLVIRVIKANKDNKLKWYFLQVLLDDCLSLGQI